MKIFAMSDIHGNIEEFEKNLDLINLDDEETKLILLGDYLNRFNYEDVRIIKLIIDLQKKYKDRVIALMGNHELYLLEDFKNKKININSDIINWTKKLPYYYETDTQIYVHAGIDEDAGEYWMFGVEDYNFCNKYPHTTGEFYKDIIAGHISVLEIAAKENSYIEKGDIYYDGKNHYYIDGETENTGIIPILFYDSEIKKYEKISINRDDR
ncbi:MAG: metallophosphoesterase [bacterium]